MVKENQSSLQKNWLCVLAFSFLIILFFIPLFIPDDDSYPISTTEPALSPNSSQPPTTLILLDETPKNASGFGQNCIDEEDWSFDGPDNGELVPNGCLRLEKWGFIVQGGELYLSPANSTECQSYSIYTSIKNNIDIRFKFRVDTIRTSTKQASIRFGIVPSSAIQRKGIFLTYHFSPESPFTLYPRLWQEDVYSAPFTGIQENEGWQNVMFSIRNNFLTITINDQVVAEKLMLRFDDRLFWINYYLPPSGELSASISEFSIEEIDVK